MAEEKLEKTSESTSDSSKAALSPSGEGGAAKAKAGAKPKSKSGTKGKSKGKKKKAAKGPSLKEILVTRILIIRGLGKDLLRSIRSPDLRTRLMAFAMLLSFMGLVVVAGLSIKRYRDIQYFRKHLSPEAIAKLKKEEAEKFRLAEIAKRQKIMESLGEFSIELRSVDQLPPIPGILNIATLEIVLECDLQVTCEWIKANIPQLRHTISTFLTSVDRMEILSREGKRKLKKAVIDRMNRQIPEGKITAMHIPHLIVN